MKSRVKSVPKRFRSDSRGVSTVIAAIFMVIIIWYVALNVFSYTLFKNDQFRDVENELDRIDIERSSEHIAASDVNFTADVDYVFVKAELENDGPVEVELVTLWVVQSATEKYGYVDELNIDLKVGETYSLAIPVEISGLNPARAFTGWFVTSRGNRIRIEEDSNMADFVKYSEQTVVTEVAGGIGLMGMDFGSFRHYEYKSVVELDNFPNGSESMDIPRDTYVAFAMNMTNKDPQEQNITIDSHSIWWSIYQKSAVPHNQWWYIVNVDSNGTISPIFTDILIPYNVTVRLVFASQTDVGFSGFTQQKTVKDEVTSPVILMLHGLVGEKPFSQTLPFVSLRFTDE